MSEYIEIESELDEWWATVRGRQIIAKERGYDANDSHAYVWSGSVPSQRDDLHCGRP